MTEHPSLELLTKKEVEEAKPQPSMSYDLRWVERQLQEITEQTKLAKAFPVALLDSQRLESIILSTTKAYGSALKEVLTKFETLQKEGKKREATQVADSLQQTNDQFQQILDVLRNIAESLKIRQENEALEREVLTKLRNMLARR